jgi:hypothetical protein
VRQVIIPPGKVIPDGAAINKQNEVEYLDNITSELIEFKNSVIRANIELAHGYRSLEIETEN